MDKVLTTYKKRGETSLETLTRLRKELNISEDTPMTYAGTLDPMAEGLLLILVGEECKNKFAYTNLDKTYEVELLFGIATDTGDILGIIKKFEKSGVVDNESLRKAVEETTSKRVMPYHNFSHKKIGGKPLFQHAKDGTLGDLELPTKEIEIRSSRLLGRETKARENLKSEIASDINLVLGDFRQKEVLEAWEKYFENSPESFTIAKIEVGCSSGTYMRLLAEEIGEKVGLPALAYKIKRTRVSLQYDLSAFSSF